MPEPIKVTPSNVINFTFNYFRSAIRKTNARSRQDAQRIRSEDLRMTPQTVGSFARRISMQDQFSKTHQQRFIDMFA